ncbi:MAG: hypothetical protein PW734_04580 [Verrucomicrobium sp.]|nr:hypothetical protein [Verrucomicrobium sp.]
MDAFIFCVSLLPLGAGGLAVVLGRRPVTNAAGLAAVLAGLAGLFLSLHASGPASVAAVLAGAAWGGLIPYARGAGLEPEEGMRLRPFGLLCGLAAALFFATVFFRAARSLSGSLPGDVSAAVDGSYFLPAQALVILVLVAVVAGAWLGRKGAA